MKTLHVYWVSDNFEELHNPEKSITLYPRIPVTAGAIENHHTERICCAMSIVDCLINLESAFIPIGNRTVYFDVYQADVPVVNLYQPTSRDVPDVWYTNELWITEPQKFNLVGIYEFRKMQQLPGSPYARFSFHRTDSDEVVDRIASAAIYGTAESFCYLEEDYSRYHEFVK